MPSITSWTRLNPRTRSEDFRSSIQAQIHDPLWLLARQWQVGEFQAGDGGAPVMARIRTESGRLTRFHPRAPRDGQPVKGQAYDGRRQPLETLVEREQIRRSLHDKPDWRLAAETGLHFVRLLNLHGAGKYRSAFAKEYAIPLPSEAEKFTLDPECRRFLLVTANRVPDGRRLYEALRTALRMQITELPAKPSIDDADALRVIRAGQTWLVWYESLFSEPEVGLSPWIAERMEYEFAVSAPTSQGETVLVAPEYQEGHLDWYAFDLRAGASLGASADDKPVEVVRTVIPAPVRYQGMPADRWWEFEDAKVFLGGADVNPEDLSRLLFMEFALSYGSDWFVIPLELPVGAVHRVRSLVITDTFGERTLIRPCHEVEGGRTNWRMFCPCPDWRGTSEPAHAPEGLLFLPPSLAASLNGPPVEEVLLLRDEMANMAWAVERVVESPLGSPLNRHEAYQRDRRAHAGPESPQNPEAGAAADYRLTTDVPEHWIPLAPVRIEKDKPDIRLQRARLLQNRSGVPVAPRPLGRLLEPGRPLSLFEEEVPRAGARVTRAYQYTRWTDGSSHLWVGRRKQPGRGEGWSGLRFDIVGPG